MMCFFNRSLLLPFFFTFITSFFSFHSQPFFLSAGELSNPQGYVFEKTRSEKVSFEGLRLRKGEETIWEIHLDALEGKPFIAPMRLSDGRDAALLRPKDHVWHLGIWFSWKYLNGVNYWEPSSGKTIIRSAVPRINEDSAEIKIQLDYVNQNEPDKVVLKEERTILFTLPEADGTYSVRFFHHFTAQEKDVVLDRTPPHRHGGGYAGLMLRLDPIFGKFETRCANGEKEMRTIREKPADWIEYRDPETGTGIRMTVEKGTPETRFYAQRSDSYCLINPCPVMTGPRTIRAGEALDLEYLVEIF